MLDFNTLCEFSRAHCIAICAFLVPANLLTAIVTMLLTVLRCPQVQVWRAVGIGNLFALIMIFHVLTWFMVGVVMAPTYILLLLGSTCLSINLWAIAHPSSLRGIILRMYHWIASLKRTGRAYS
jgi:hypothetical protein